MADEWFPTTLGECIDVKHGFAFKGEFIHEEPYGDILLTPGNFAIDGGFKGDKFKYYSGPEVPEFILRQGDLLVSMTDLSKDGDTLGYPALIPKSQDGRRFLHISDLGKFMSSHPRRSTPAFSIICCVVLSIATQY
jgi:type I restriction enzyme, S subunit